MWALRPLLLWARCWGVRPLAALGVITAAGWFVVPAGPVPVPAGNGVASLVWPLLPVVVVLGVPGVLGAADGDLERTSSRRPILLRLAALMCCLLVPSIDAVLATRFDARVVWRNTAFLLALAILATKLLPRAMRWQPLVLIPMAMWLLGNDEHRHIRPWSLLLLPGDRLGPAVVAVAALLVAVVAELTVPSTAGGWGGRQPVRKAQTRPRGRPRRDT